MVTGVLVEQRPQRATPSHDDLGVAGRHRRQVEVDHYLAAVSHALREPVRQVIELTETLRRRGGADAEVLAAVTEVSRRMERTIRALVRHGDWEQVPFDDVPVDLGQLVDEVVSDMAPLLAEHGARIEVGELPRVRGATEVLRVAVTNLLHNAVVHGGAGRRAVDVELSVVVDTARSLVILSVHDDGVGIPAGMHEAAFDPLRRLHADPTREGIGLGLATVRRCVRAHGGSVRLVDGPDGTGTTAIVELPA